MFDSCMFDTGTIGQIHTWCCSTPGRGTENVGVLKRFEVGEGDT